MEKLKQYVEEFNGTDRETCKNDIDNAHAYAFLKEEIPLFECPDTDVERIYYFRWWTYRKHLKHTEDGYVITEFLPPVSWSRKHNVINAACGHHIREGRWLKNAKTYLNDYISFLLNNPEISHFYSTWLISALEDLYLVTGQTPTKDQILALCDYYTQWEEEHRLPNGMFWSFDGHDAMEYSISGRKDGIKRKGIRPTLNTYLCADAGALSRLAKRAGMEEVAATYAQKQERLKQLIFENLWHKDFFKAFHYDGEDWASAFSQDKDALPRELLGYIPWYFDLPEKEHDTAFDFLEKEGGFMAPFGLCTAEMAHPKFLYEADHECLWNGYVWPYATAQTLTALMRFARRGPENVHFRKLFVKLLLQYAKGHFLTLKDGTRLPWIDEVKHPFRDEWTARTLLNQKGWPQEHNGQERGKDYNHSTFCDLIISGLMGVTPEGDTVTFDPMVPEDWDYCCLKNLTIQNQTYDIFYDKTGTHYGFGKGVTVHKR